MSVPTPVTLLDRQSVCELLREDDIIILDSTGTALQDAAAAAVVYERALAKGLGSSFSFWS